MHDSNQPLPFDESLDEPTETGGSAPTASVFAFRQRRTGATNPVNHGQPWTDEQHELLVERVRAGGDLEAIADAVGRKPASVAIRIRRMLPPDNREHPTDLVVSVLRQYLGDVDADWRGNLLRSTTPRPVITPPPIVRTGIGGIENDDLVCLAHALIAAQGREGSDLLARLLGEVQDRGLTWQLVSSRVRDLRYARDCALSDVQLIDAAESWVYGAINPERREVSRYEATWTPRRY